MKLLAEINGKVNSLNLQREKERVTAEIDGRRYTLEVREIEAGVYLIVVDNRVYECRLDKLPAQRGESVVHVNKRSYSVLLSDPKRLRDAKTSGADSGGRATIKAPMPGKVVRVMVNQGAEVQAGDGLVVVEAMKMQNEMKSPKTGTVVEIQAKEGATVNAGDILALIE